MSRLIERILVWCGFLALVVLISTIVVLIGGTI
jgi:hypothetical protein